MSFVAVDPHRPLRVSVVVCTYSGQRLQGLQNCLRSLETQVRQADEILLVIDHNPELFELAGNLFPKARVLASDRARGASGARNFGIANASGDVVAFLDDDTSADETWLLELVKPYDDDSVLGTMGEVAPRWPGSRPVWLPPEFDWVIGCTYRGMPRTLAPVRNLWGPMSFRRLIVADLGGFDETIGLVSRNALGCEETELSLRVRSRYRDGSLLYVPSARTTHHLDAPRLRIRYFIRRCYGEGLSKAAVAFSVGAGPALATERVYAVKVLPVSVVRYLGRSLKGHPGDALRAVLIVVGFMITAAGYLRGRIGHVRAPRLRETLPSTLRAS